MAVESASAGDDRQGRIGEGYAVLVVFGDYVKEHPRWAASRNRHRIRQRLQGGGRQPRLIDLPDVGIKGNSHMMMMDKNNDEIAEFIQNWLVGKGCATNFDCFGAE